MRTISRVLLLLFFVSLSISSTLAASPFELLLKYLPDIAVTDMYQKTNLIYIKVCNKGGSLADSEDTLVLAVWVPGGGVVSMNTPVLWDSDNCHEFNITSIDKLGIGVSGSYNITAGAVIKNGRAENIKTNNKLTKTMYIEYPSKTSVSSSATPSSVYYYPNNTTTSSTYYYPNSNTYYCNSSNNYCYNNNYNNNNYYCNSTNNYCNSTYYCNSSNNYCSNYTSSNAYYRTNICPSGDTACNYLYYNSTPYQSTYCNSSNNYCNSTYYCNSSNNYCYNNSYYNNTYYCNSSNNYCNAYNSNYYNNYYDRPDLVVQRVYQNSSDKHIVADICNQGGDMRTSASVRTNFSTNNMVTSMYNTVQLSRGQCMYSSIYTTPPELNIFYNGNYYPFSVTVDANNNVDESNESNNTTNQSLQIWTY